MDVPKNRPSALASTIRWVARILCILAIAFISLFAVEAVEGKVGLGPQIVGFLMAPPFLMAVPLIIILIIAWKRELFGGVLFALIGLAASMFVYSLNYNRSHSFSRGLQTAAMIGAPFVIAGLLFMISYFLHRPKTLAAQTR
jgi:hypothetical protein